MLAITQCPIIGLAQMKLLWCKWENRKNAKLQHISRWFENYLQNQQIRIIHNWQLHRYFNQQLAEMKQFWNYKIKTSNLSRIRIQLWREDFLVLLQVFKNFNIFIMCHLTHQAFICQFFFHRPKRNRCVGLGFRVSHVFNSNFIWRKKEQKWRKKQSDIFSFIGWRETDVWDWADQASKCHMLFFFFLNVEKRQLCKFFLSLDEDKQMCGVGPPYQASGCHMSLTRTG